MDNPVDEIDRTKVGIGLVVAAFLLILSNTSDLPVWLEIVFRGTAFGLLMFAFVWWRRNRGNI